MRNGNGGRVQRSHSDQETRENRQEPGPKPQPKAADERCDRNGWKVSGERHDVCKFQLQLEPEPLSRSTMRRSTTESRCRAVATHRETARPDPKTNPSPLGPQLSCSRPLVPRKSCRGVHLRITYRGWGTGSSTRNSPAGLFVTAASDRATALFEWRWTLTAKDN